MIARPATLTDAANEVFRNLVAEFAELSNSVVVTPRAEAWDQHRLADFLKVYIHERGLDRQQFVNALASKFDFQPSLMRELLEAILDGVLPDAQIDSLLLTEIGVALDISAVTLRKALDRTLNVFSQESMETFSHEPRPIMGRRYTIQRWLGSGAMGNVYQAIDRLTEQPIALKQVNTPLHNPSRGEQHRVHNTLALAHEFQLLASLRHPYIIRVLDYGFDIASQPFYTMDLLDGTQNILEYGATIALADRVKLLVELLYALAYLHRCQILHRDLKPANVLISHHHVKVLDFGLAIIRQKANGAAGTPKYMAPEILNGGSASEASDLFSVGVIAYELLTGHYPFSEIGRVNLFEAILCQSPDLACNGLEPSLNTVLERLLAKSSENRFSSANQVIEALRSVTDLGILIEPAHVRESFLQAVPLVGRRAEMAFLQDQLQRAHTGGGGTWLFGGESGVGKSRLLVEFTILAQVDGAFVVRGQAVREGNIFSVWKNILKRLALAYDLEDSTLEIFKTFYPGVEDRSGRNAATTRKANISELVQAIGDIIRLHDQVVVIFLEDLQWADKSSLLILEELSKRAEELPLLILGTFRDDEYPDLPNRLPSMKPYKVTRLSPSAVSELCEIMLGQAAQNNHLVNRLVAEAEGNAFFLVEIVRALAEGVDTLSEIAVDYFPEIIATKGIQEIVQRRLNQIQPQHRPILELAAILGRQVDLAVLHNLEPQPTTEIDLETWVMDCASHAILEVSDGEWRFTHDKLRDGVLSVLPEDVYVTLHRQVAEALETTYPNSPEYAAPLAHHWRIVGNPAKEAIYAGLAGEQCLKAGSFLDAVEFLQRTLQISRDDGTSEAGRQIAFLQCRMADAYREIDRYPEALEYYGASLKTFTALADRDGIAYIKRNLGTVALNQGNFSQAIKHYQESAVLYEALKDRRAMAVVWGGIGKAIEYGIADYPAAERYYHDASAIFLELGDQQGQLSILNNLGNVNLKQGNYTEARDFFARSHTIAREISSKRGAMVSLNNMGITDVRLGAYDEAEVELHEAMAFCVSNDDWGGIGGLLNQYGLVALAKGSLESALEYFQKSLELQRRAGLQPGIAELLRNLGQVHLVQGDHQTALAYSMEAVAIFRTINDKRGLAMALSSLGEACLERGEVEEAVDNFRESLSISMTISASPQTLEALVGVAHLLAKTSLKEDAREILSICHKNPAAYEGLRQHIARIFQQEEFESMEL